MISTIETIAIMLFVGWLFLIKTWIGKSVLNILKGIIGLSKTIYLFSCWSLKCINNTNGRLKQKIDKINKSQSNASKSKKCNVIDIESHKKAK